MKARHKAAKGTRYSYDDTYDDDYFMDSYDDSYTASQRAFLLSIVFSSCRSTSS